MSDIFISYASEDRERIMPLVRAFEKTGWSVFWDRAIPTGKHWRQVIGKEIEECGAMIVVWSKNSLDSKFVMQEASEGQRREILFPVVIDNIIPPFGFREEQAQDLAGWNGTEPYPAYDRLVNDITMLLGTPPITVEKEQKQKEAEAKRKALEEERKAEIDRKIQEEERMQKEEEVKRKAAEEEQKQKDSEAKRIATEKERQQQEQIATLYNQAKGLVRLREWEQVQVKMKKIQALNPQFEDSEGISNMAQEGLKGKAERLEQERLKKIAQVRPPSTKVEREKDNETAIFAEYIKDEKRIIRKMPGRDVLTILRSKVVSLAQTVWLSRKLYLKWVLFSAMGWAIIEIVSSSWNSLFQLPLCGTGAGIMQWIILRKHFSKAGWWVLVSCVGWFVGGLFFFLIYG